MSLGWARRVVRRHPQSVTDYDVDNLRSYESLQVEIPGVPGEANPPSLPVNVSGVTGFQNLPDELLEQIFQKISGSSRRNYFAVSGVSRSWRRLGNKMFFSSPWDTPHLICHPNQLFCLSPRTPSGSRSGLLKCFVRRDPRGHTLPNGRVVRKISLFLGKDPLNSSRARFLLCALRPSRHETLLYLNSKCEGPPCARLVSNLFCTSYTLENGMRFSLEGPNCTTTTNSTNNMYNNSTIDSNNGGNGGGATATAATFESGEENEITSDESPDQMPSAVSPAAYHSSPPLTSSLLPSPSASVIPPLLMSLRYRARVRGIMQPRRMDAALPNPNFMACNGALPKMQRISNVDGAAGGTNGSGAPADAGGASIGLPRRPSLGYISSVAALERPPTNEERTIRSPTTTSAASTHQVIGDDDGAGPSYSSPSSAYTSLAPSPEGILPLIEASSSTVPGLTPAAASGAVAPAPVPTAPTASSPSSATATASVFSYWRRVLGFDRPQNTTSAAAAAATASTSGSFSFLGGAHRGATFDESALPVCLVNKSPHWNEALRCWCLNFRGRVKLASVKNFQLVKDGDEDAKVSMQFGKFDKDLFILDFNPMTLSAIQAFTIALTTFDSKVTL